MNFNSALLACAFGFLFVESSSFGETDPGFLRLNSPQYQAEAAKYRSAPARPYEFAKAVLGDVIRFLATDAGLSFFSLPEGSPEAERLITFSLKASPFQALETLTKANGLSLILDGGIWYVRPADDTELIGRSYEIKNNAMEKVTQGSTGGSGLLTAGSSGAGSTGGTSGGTSTGTDGSSGVGNSGGSSSGGVDIQGTRATFTVQKSELIEDIRSILDLGPASANGGGGSTPLATAASSLGGGDAQSQQILKNRLPLDPYGNIRKPKIIWKSDSNTLYVVATRLQHMWVEGYLAAADQPQSLIALEVKFFETSRDPSSEFGLDWSGTLTGGYPVNLGNLTTPVNLAQLGSTTPPTQAVLSANDLNVKLHALLNDQLTTTTSYPRMVTTNNREVNIRSVTNQPVLAGTASTGLAGGTTTTSSISYLPIGTDINILPKRMKERKINLNIAITVSSIIGTTTIQGNPYPIASSRVYNAPVEVENGYTVAIGGLEEATEQTANSGIPVLNKIPLLGFLFKSQNRTKDHKHLMIFITPSFVDSTQGGLPSEPQSVLPRKPDEFMPHPPQLAPTGGVVGGIAALPNAIAYLKRSADEIGQTIQENRGTDKDYTKLKELKAAVDRIKKETIAYLAANPQRKDELNGYKWQLDKISEVLTKERKTLFKKGYY